MVSMVTAFAYEKLVESYRAGRAICCATDSGLTRMGDEALCYALEPFVMRQQPEGHKAVGIAVAVSLCRLARIRTITRHAG